MRLTPRRQPPARGAQAAGRGPAGRLARAITRGDGVRGDDVTVLDQQDVLVAVEPRSLFEPDDQGPVRLIVHGDRARSAYALAKIEVKVLAENKKKP